MIQIRSLDHLVLTVADIRTTCAFYGRILGLREVTFAEGRRALVFGNQKINLHQHGAEFDPKALRPTPGSADLCLLTETSPNEVLRHLSDCGVPVIEGPVARTGATGPITSVYFRDPDGNLVEVASPRAETESD